MIFKEFFNEGINKIDSYGKNKKYITNFDILKNGNNDNLFIVQCKIPFNNKDYFQSFVNRYKGIIKYINNL